MTFAYCRNAQVKTITEKEKKLSLDMHTVSAFMFIALYMPKDSNELFELY